LFTFLLFCQFYWHIRLKLTAFFFDPPCTVHLVLPHVNCLSELFVRRFFDLFEKYGGYELGHLKLKHPKQLQEVLDIARFLLGEVNTHHDPEIEEKKPKLEQLKAVLEM